MSGPPEEEAKRVYGWLYATTMEYTAKGKGEQSTTPASIPQIHRPEVGESSRSAADITKWSIKTGQTQCNRPELGGGR